MDIHNREKYRHRFHSTAIQNKNPRRETINPEMRGIGNL